MDDDDCAARSRPNNIFLSRMLHGVGRTNQRQIETNASLAAQKAVGASGAASLRPTLVRAGKKGAAAVRTATLTAAQQQKLTLCTSLLREVARTFGYKLLIRNPDGTQAPAETVIELKAAEVGGSAAEADNGNAEDKAFPSTDYLPLQELQVALRLPNSAIDDEYEEIGDEEGAVVAKGAAVGRAARGAAVMSRASVLAARKASSPGFRPRLALHALDSIGAVLTRGGSNGLGGAGVRRKALVKPASKNEAGSQDEDGNEKDSNSSEGKPHADTQAGTGTAQPAAKAGAASKQAPTTGEAGLTPQATPSASQPPSQQSVEPSGAAAGSGKKSAVKNKIVWGQTTATAAAVLPGQSETAVVEAAAEVAPGPAAATKAPQTTTNGSGVAKAGKRTTPAAAAAGEEGSVAGVEEGRGAAGAAGRQARGTAGVAGRKEAASEPGSAATEAEGGLGVRATPAATPTAQPAPHTSAPSRRSSLVSPAPSETGSEEQAPAGSASGARGVARMRAGTAKRGAAAGLFGAVMRDLKKVKAAPGDCPGDMEDA